MLADLGADVVKLEPTQGDASRHVGWSQDDFGPMFSAYNRGKRSVVLDIHTAAGRDKLLALLEGAISFTEGDAVKPVYILEVKGGKWTLLDTRMPK